MATFKRFSDFPAEIRLRIWEEAAAIPIDEHIVAEFHGVPFYPARGKENGTLKYRYTLRLGGDCNALGTLGANVESREATLRQNPDVIQLNNGPKLYFNADRNIIHLDLTSIYFIRNYLLQDCRRFWKNQNGVLWTKVTPSKVDYRAKKLKGLDAIKTLSFPPLICDVSAVVYNMLLSDWTPFRRVQRIVPRKIPNTIRYVTTWGDFMKKQIGEMLLNFDLKLWQELALEKILKTTYAQLDEVWCRVGTHLVRLPEFLRIERLFENSAS